MTAPALVRAEAPGVEVFRRGKVRDTFTLPDGTLLMVASDRISAFDVVIPTPIPGKGRILTQMSRWWFARSAHIVPNHLRDDDPATLPGGVDWSAWAERSMRVAHAERIDVECVARGYLAGSGYKEYRTAGTLAGEALPPGLRESSPLPEPRFTPATKSDEGHDENISRGQLADMVGSELATRLEDLTLGLFRWASGVAAASGMILADTKLEFGVIDGELCVIDEMFTPDSSRFWDAAIYREGESQPAFDKQILRDWLEASGWDKSPPAPELPADVAAATGERYREAARRLCALELA